MGVYSVNKTTGDLELIAGSTLYADAPIGSYLAMKDNSVKPQGYLLSNGKDTTGTVDELSTKYPSLYAYLGNTNILPTEFDHSVLGAPEDISTNLNHTTNSNYYTAPYDGVIIINWTPADRYKSVYWSNDGTNWTEFVYNLDTATYQTTTIPVKKGVRLYLRDSVADNVIYACFYKQYKYIKAKQVAMPLDVKNYISNLEDTVAELEDTVADLEDTVAELDESNYEWKFLGWFGKTSLGGVSTVYVPKGATKVRLGISSSDLGGENPVERDVRYYPFKETDRQLMADYSGSLFSVATYYKHAINAYLYFVGFEPEDMAGDTPSDTTAKHYILRMHADESTVDSSDTDSIQVYAYVPEGTVIRYDS